VARRLDNCVGKGMPLIPLAGITHYLAAPRLCRLEGYGAAEGFSLQEFVLAYPCVCG